MLGLGKWNPFPLRFGGGQAKKQQAYLAILDALEPGFSADDPANQGEAMAAAVAIAIAWAVNKRLTNQAIPTRMLENLTEWEQILKLRPTVEDTDQERRARVAAKVRGFGNNAIADINDAVAKVLGANYEDTLFVDPSNEVTYWPGVNPGPPGFEWASNRAKLSIKMNKNGLSNKQFIALRQSVADLLDALLPSWMTFSIGVGDAFVFNQGLLGQTFI